MTKTIVIVGGGSAGWLTAGIIAARHNPRSDNEQGIKVILLESPDVANLGVGEGTWPSMRTTLQNIGIDEADFIRQCDASMKQGTWFKDAHEFNLHNRLPLSPRPFHGPLT